MKHWLWLGLLVIGCDAVAPPDEAATDAKQRRQRADADADAPQAAATGQTAAFSLDAVSAKSLLSLAYLTIFGSLVGFTAYIWLLGATTASRLSTYAYVNPVVALRVE